MSLRERLRDRQRPVETYMLRVDDPADAQQAYNRAVDELRIEQLSANDEESSPAVKRAKAKVEKARKAIEACFEPVRVRALPPSDYEALMAAHKPPEGSDEPFDDDFPHELFLACVEGDMTREDWELFFKENCSKQERIELQAAALIANNRTTTGDGIPKD